jgi:tetratricopeptide (TPR) repeat protein
MTRALLALLLLVAPLALPAVTHAAPSGEGQRRLREAWDTLDSARALLARGDEKRANKRLAEAERAYRDLLRVPDSEREAALGLSAVLFLQRRYADGVALLRPLHDRLPDDPDLTHQLGLHLYRSGEQDLALPLLEAVATDPERFDACWLLVQHYYRIGNYQAGLPHAERYLAARPDDLEALSVIGSYYLKIEQFDQAITLFDRFLVRFPDNVPVRVNRANALFRKGDLDAAALAYERLLAREPARSRFLYNLASVRIRQGRCAEALDLLATFLEAEPRHGPGLYFRADCLLTLARYDEAERAFDDARAAGQDDNPWIWHGLSRLAARRGDPDKALTLAEKALALAPDEADLPAWLGTLLRRAGRPAEALVAHERALVLAPGNSAHHSERARDLWALDRPADALAGFERALKLDPSTPGILAGLAATRTALGNLATRDGRLAEAESHFTMALEADADDPAARANLALLRLASRRLDEAAVLLEGAGDAADLVAARAVLAFERGAPTSTIRPLLDLARNNGTTLTAILARVDGHLAARDGAWADAVRAFDEALRLAPAPYLEQARTQALFELALERLGRGDLAAAREALAKVNKLAPRLSPDDRQILDFANAILAALGADNPEVAARTLATHLAAPRYAAKSMARVRDIGHGYVAWSYLRAGRPAEARKALDKVVDRGSLGLALDTLAVAITDLEARKAYAANDFPTAERVWADLLKRFPDPVLSHNLAAARFMLLRTTEAEASWSALVDASPRIDEALYNLGNALARRGEHALATDFLVRYSKTNGPTAPLARERAATRLRLFGPGGRP